MNAEWMEILYKVKSGELSVEDAAQQMDRPEPFGTEPVFPPGQTSSDLPNEEPFNPEIGLWKYAWLVILGVGTLIFVPAAMFMGWAYSSDRFFWFYCAWLPLLLGLLIFFIGVWSQSARWAHIRIHDSDGTRISISVPLPMRLAGWFMRIFGSKIPGLRDQKISGEDIAPIFDALENTKDPISVEVDDNGDHVRVYVI